MTITIKRQEGVTRNGNAVVVICENAKYESNCRWFAYIKRDGYSINFIDRFSRISLNQAINKAEQMGF